jgi:hypothetical protein
VANGGTGFTESNTRAISNLGLSDKPVGEGIGNKGVGFKSVLQVCAAPEIYSRSCFDTFSRGFCFRFAQPADILELVDGDQALAAAVLADVSLYNLLVPVEETPGLVARLWDQGYVTVVRLPLRSAAAQADARLRLDELKQSSVPVMLFLRRIHQLTIEESSGGGTRISR